MIYPKTKRKWNPLSTIEYRFRDISSSYPEIAEQGKIKVINPEIFHDTFKSIFQNLTKEIFCVFFLNSNNHVTGFEIISEGVLSESLVHPREVFRGAIIATTKSIILAHNHPSDNSEPSVEDIVITKKLIEAGKILDIPIFDHVIFANTSWTSFVEKRLI